MYCLEFISLYYTVVYYVFLDFSSLLALYINIYSNISCYIYIYPVVVGQYVCWSGAGVVVVFEAFFRCLRCYVAAFSIVVAIPLFLLCLYLFYSAQFSCNNCCCVAPFQL